MSDAPSKQHMCSNLPQDSNFAAFPSQLLFQVVKLFIRHGRLVFKVERLHKQHIQHYCSSSSSRHFLKLPRRQFTLKASRNSCSFSPKLILDMRLPPCMSQMALTKLQLDNGEQHTLHRVCNDKQDRHLGIQAAIFQHILVYNFKRVFDTACCFVERIGGLLAKFLQV